VPLIEWIVPLVDAELVVTRRCDLRYRILAARATASNPGELTLALRVRMTNGGRYSANFWNCTFRLRIGADTSAPTNFLDELFEAGTTKMGDVDFNVAAGARRATLLVGDDPAKAISLPLRLAPLS
jgi:hypothetical protein